MTEPFFKFTIELPPVPKPRPKVSIRGRGKRQWAHAYMPAAYIKYEADVRRLFTAEMHRAGLKPTTDKVVLFARFYRGDARRVDVDNCEKALCDTTLPVVMEDDSQILLIFGYKEIDRKFPRTEVEIYKYDDFVQDREAITLAWLKKTFEH